jgi:predicted phage terminase large subunit-like protein
METEAVSDRREQAIAVYRDTIRQACELGAESVWRIKRGFAKRDLFFLLAYVLGRPDVNRDWVFDRLREVQAAPNGYLDLWGRGHYKSTAITFGLTIQDILNDPEITIGIFSYSRPIAKAFLRQIKVEFENNEMLRSLFPDILWENPHRDAPKWSEDDGIVVRRKGNPKESTIEAWGLVDSSPVSKHFGLMVYDDVVTGESVGTPEMIGKTTTAWERSLNLTAEHGIVRYIGTRWSFNDTYRVILERHAAIERRHPSTIDGSAGGSPVLFTPERLAEIRERMGRYVFAAQHLLDPAAERDQSFSDDWLRYFDPDEGDCDEMRRYILVDPANSKKKTSDFTVMAVVGLGADQNYYLLDVVRDRLNLAERCKALFRLHRKWRPDRVGYEKYGMQADIEYCQEKMRLENYRFEVIELGGKLSKEDRIRRLIPIFESGRFYLPTSLWRVNLEGRREDLVTIFVDQEFKPFPVAVHDDFIDAISRICDAELGTIWPQAHSERRVHERYTLPRRGRRRHVSQWVA